MALRPSARPWLLLLLLPLATAPRLAAIFTVGEVAEAHGDEWYYLVAAQSLVRGDGYPGSMRPPAFPAFLALVLNLTGGGLTALRLAQVPLALLSVAMVFDLVSRRFGPRAGFVSGLFVAWSPDLVHYTHYLWSETLLTTLVLAVAWALDRHDHEGRWFWLVLAGLALGAAALTREMALYLVLPASYWLWRVAAPRAARNAALLTLVAAACILPWTLRNYRLHGRLVLVSTNRWYPIAEGNLLTGGDPVEAARKVRALRQAYHGNRDEMSREAEARRVALGAIRAQQPGWIVRKALMNICLLFAPSRNQLGRFLDRGWLSPRWQGVAARLAAPEAVLYGFSMIVGLTALWLVPDARLKWLVVSFVAVFLAVYVAANAAHRFRVPLLPLLTLYSGPLLCGHAAATRPRLLRAGLTVAAFLAVLVADRLGLPVVLVRAY